MKLINRIADISPNRLARIAGLGYLIIIISGIFAEFAVRGSLIVQGDPAATFENIAASQTFFRFGLIGDIVMITADILVAVALYLLLKPVSRILSLLAGSLRFLQAAILGANLLNLVLVTILASGVGFLSALGRDQLQAQVMLNLNAHQFGYALGLVFFGLHCLILAYLLLKSRYVPRVLSILLLIAGVGYLTDSLARLLMTNYSNYETLLSTVVFVPAFVGELLFCLWLIFRGVNKSKSVLTSHAHT